MIIVSNKASGAAERNSGLSSRALVLASCSLLGLLPATSAAAPAVTAEGEEPSIVITGQRPASVAASGTKSDTPLLETPQSISVITRADLDAQGISNLNQALRYTAGITPETRGANAEVYDQFTLRGFTVPRYLDGLRVYGSPTGYAEQQVDTSRLDRIEVVKGPASVLYGQSSPGGLIALSSKLPTAGKFYGGVEATYGTFNLYRVDADIGGQANASGSIRYRLYGSVNGADTQQSFGKRRRYTISPAVTFGADSDTTLTLLGNYSHDPYNGNYGSVPLYGSVRPNINGRVPRDWADGDPSLTRIRRNQASGAYFLTHRFGDNWVFRANGRYADITANFLAPYQYGTLDATQRIDPRGIYGSDEHLHNWTFDQQLAGKVETGALTHNLLFGVDFQTQRARQDAGFDSTTAIDVFAPVYNLSYAPLAFTSHYKVRQRQTGLYAQDQVSVGALRLTASGRYDFSYGRRTFNGGAPDRQKDEKFTYRLGAVYVTDFGLAPYVSYSTSFEPSSSAVLRSDGTTGIAKPTLGKQIEGGLKYQVPGTPILLTAAYFKIDQTNVVVSNPLTFIATQAGKVRSEGFELEAKVPVFKGLNLTANFSHQKVQTVRDANPANVGRPLIGVGKDKAGVFADYQVPEGALQGFGIGGGVRYVGRVYGGWRGTAAAPDYVYSKGYTLVDGVISYDLGRAFNRMQGVKLSVNATNLFDTRHVTSCYVNFFEWCWYGQRRTVQGTIGYRF